MTKKSDAPAIRFKGFSDAWEQRKLSELTSMHARIGWQNLRTSEFLDSGNYMLITGTDFNDGAINFSTCHYVERERYEQDRNIQIHNGSILITKDGTLGKVAYVQGLSMPATLNAGVFNVQIKDANNVDEKYLFQYLKAPFLMDYVDKKATGGTIKHLNQSILVDFPVILPQRSEQTLIGAFFQQLDNLITLHQRKFEKLTNVKKSMLEKMFPQNGSSYPEIRFKGFTDPWEQRKLGEIGSVSMCRRIFKEQTSETGDIPFYKIGTFGAEPDAFISRELFEEYKSKYPYPKKGDILISASGSIGRTVEFAGNNEYFQDSNIVWLSHDERLSNSFLKCFYSVVKWAGIEGSTIKRLYNDNILNTVICMPSVPEQEHIGLFFENLDNLITLHQRKFEKLTNVKKSMLEKMFPQNGSSYPEIRFKGFTDPWEQRKLGELVDVCSGRDYKHLSEGTIPVYGTGGYMLSVNDALSYDRDAIGIGRKGTIDRPYILKAPFWTVDTLFYAIPREKVDLNYAFDIFQNIDWKKKDESTGVPSLSKTAINDIDVLAPKHDEQQIIGQFFAAIDNLITLHQRELEKLQNIKKSMLEKMFV